MNDTAMTDRERIMRALRDNAFPNIPDEDLYTDRCGFLRSDADAVLAAIGDRLLPATHPEWAFSILIEGIHSDVVAATYDEFVMDGGRDPRYASGAGPTIPAAIRNALEGDQ